MDESYNATSRSFSATSRPAYIASPNFPTYQYCWFRDGSFSAYAMDLAGQHESSHRFHQWVADRVNERKQIVRSTLVDAPSGGKLSERDILHTRYRLDGSDGEPGEWPNFQLDGFGTWLWALGSAPGSETPPSGASLGCR
jgi:GH15 family glucan-1,4-alpha-glucosidase